MSTKQRRALLRAMEDEVFNETLAWLLSNGLVVFLLSHDSVDFRVTPKGRLWLEGSDAFHPTNGGVPA